MATTEIYVWGEAQWQQAAPLSMATYGVRGATLANNFFIVGRTSFINDGFPYLNDFSIPLPDAIPLP